ncbi:MAG: D-glycero-beta-D-manno-heptose 1-phosphate adenylyltransferase [Candidatus Krumholzibacteriota bacterium]|nr:D-glycero-beta-D-manno-heptose 1-phosphate adenylyltransferase [Candidatus Krumholzibacteriota bacterium]
MKNLESRILSREELAAFRERNRGAKIVFTNGCFDILHRGHVTLLKQAREFGDCLVVGLNADASVRRLKGPGRPLNRETDRIFVLLQLRSVDYVTVFGEDTPLETLRALRPDVLVKGDEYDREEIVGAELVEEGGGRVERIKMLGGYSTSGLIQRIREGS